MPAPQVGDVRPELEKHIVPDVSGNGGPPRFKNDAGVGAGMRVIGGGERRGGKVAEDVGVVEAVAAVIALDDEGALGGPADAALVTAGSFAEVARIFMQQDGERAVAEEAHGGLAQKRGTHAVAEGFAVGAVVGAACELPETGGDQGREGGGDTSFLVQPEDPFVTGVEGRDAFPGIDVLRPLAFFKRRVLDGAGGFRAGLGGWILRAGLRLRDLLERARRPMEGGARERRIGERSG